MNFELIFCRARSSAAALWVGAAAALQGCALSTPYPTLDAEGPPVLMVITHGTLDTSRRAEFDRQTFKVVATLPGQAGLLGYSVRREMFGAQVWTISLWRDDESLARFNKGAAHRRAIDSSANALVDMRSLRQRVARSEVPAGWDEALDLLRSGHARHWWE